MLMMRVAYRITLICLGLLVNGISVLLAATPVLPAPRWAKEGKASPITPPFNLILLAYKNAETSSLHIGKISNRNSAQHLQRGKLHL
jgi:hypothetical protein